MKRVPVIQSAAGPSPYVSMYLSRRQAEDLWHLVRRLPSKKWARLEASLRASLNNHAGPYVYAADGAVVEVGKEANGE